MTVGAMELHGYFGEKFPLLSADRTRDVLAAYVAIRFPAGRRKYVAQEWNLTPEEARSVCEGAASQATLDKIWLHKRGGWPLLLPIFGMLLGETVEEHIEKEKRRHAEHARRLGALIPDFRSERALRLDLHDSADRQRGGGREPLDRRAL